MTAPPVTFLFPDGERALDGIRVDRDWRFFGTGLWAWIAQTFLRLRDAGHTVRVSDVPPPGGIVVYHPDYRGPEEGPQVEDRRDAITVAVRADRKPEDRADFEIVQNGCFADGRRVFFVPHWPQPGLVPRDASRGVRIQTVAFKGHDTELHPDLRGGKWLHFIEEAGLQWMIDAAAYRGPSVDYAKVHWDDFRRVDLVLALRPLERALSMAKLATKLQNAWAAAVPAILGPERPYRELRRSDLDYIEVRNGDSAIKVVRYLRDHPSIYRAMVENGRGRARDFTVARTIGVWMTLLFETIPAAASDRRMHLRRSAPTSLLVPDRWVRERVIGAVARLRLRW